MDTFGKKLRECREAKNLSQKDLAGILNTSYSVIGKYERDEMIPSIEVAKNIAKILGTTVGYLLGETEEVNIFKNPAMLNRFNDIEKLDPENKEHLLSVVDGFIKALKFKYCCVMKKYFLILISFLFLGCNFDKTYHNREEDKQDAQKITEKFYSLLKSDNRAEAFKLIDNKFFEKTDKKQLNQMIDDINAECGDKISDTQLTIWETFVSVGTSSKSQYVLSYKVKRNIQNTQEKITLEKDDDSIKIMGYDVSIIQ